MSPGYYGFVTNTRLENSAKRATYFRIRIDSTWLQV